MDPQELVGLPEADAITKAKAAGFVVRVISRDGEHYIVTQEYRFDRINLGIESGKVAGVTFG